MKQVFVKAKQIYSQSFEKYWSGVGASLFKNAGAELELELEPFIFKDAGAELELEP